MLIVIIFWFLFWILLGFLLVCVGFGIIIVLIMIMILNSVCVLFFKVFYIKVIDWFFFMCLVYVFGVFMEYVIVNFYLCKV